MPLLLHINKTEGPNRWDKASSVCLSAPPEYPPAPELLPWQEQLHFYNTWMLPLVLPWELPQDNYGVFQHRHTGNLWTRTDSESADFPHCRKRPVLSWKQRPHRGHGYTA